MRYMGYSAALVCFFLAACGAEDAEPEQGVFDPLTDAVDEAEQLDQVAVEQKARLDAALDEAEGDTDRRPD